MSEPKLIATLLDSEIYEQWKLPNTWATSVCTRDNVICSFYEDESENISCAISRDNGGSFYCHKHMVRLLDGETASKPVAFFSQVTGYIYLFYLFQDNFLAFKLIDPGDFLVVDSYVDSTRLYNFDEFTADDAGLEDFTPSGRVIRSSVSYLIDGDSTGNIGSSWRYGQLSIDSGGDLWAEIEEINPLRTNSGMSTRFELVKSKQDYVTNWSNIPYSVYLDKNGSIRLWYIKNDLLSIKTSIANQLWIDTIRDIRFHKLVIETETETETETVDLSYDEEDFYDHAFITYSYGYYNKIELESENEDEDESEDEDLINRYAEKYEPDGNMKAIKVVYSDNNDNIIVLFTYNRSLYLRIINNDYLYRFDNERVQYNIDRGISIGDLEEVVNENFHLTEDSPNKPILIAGVGTEDLVYPDRYPSIGIAIFQSEVRVDVVPTGISNGENIYKIFFYQYKDSYPPAESEIEAPYREEWIRYLAFNVAMLVDKAENDELESTE
jgi:hypothetical protein